MLGVGASEEEEEWAGDEREREPPREAALANHCPPCHGNPTLPGDLPRHALTELSAAKPGIRPDALKTEQALP